MRIAGKVAAAAVSVLLLAGCSPSVVAGRPHAPTSARGSSSPASSAAPTSASPPASGPLPAPSSRGARLFGPAVERRIEAETRADLRDTNNYSYRTLATDLAAGLAHTTGAFRMQYRTAFTTLVEPTARKTRAGQSLQVNVIGLQSRPGPTQAGFLAEVQTRITRRSAAPRITPEAVSVTVAEVHGRWLLSGVRIGGGGGPLGPVGTAGLVAAGRAAATGIVDITTLRRAHFAADYARALAATTGDLRRDLVHVRAKTLATLIHQRDDLSGVVTGVAAVSGQGDTATLLVTSTTYRSSSRDTPSKDDLEIVVQRVGTRWLLSDVTTLGVR